MLHYSSQHRLLVEHRIWTDALGLLVVLAAALGGAYLVGASPSLSWDGPAQALAQLRGLLRLG